MGDIGSFGAMLGLHWGTLPQGTTLAGPHHFFEGIWTMSHYFEGGLL